MIVIKKRDKFMVGHGYATGLGYSFTWTSDIKQARRFKDGDGAALSLSQLSGGKMVDLKTGTKES